MGLLGLLGPASPGAPATRLDVSNNDIGNLGLEDVALALPRARCLSSLSLEWNALTAMDQLAEVCPPDLPPPPPAFMTWIAVNVTNPKGNQPFGETTDMTKLPTVACKAPTQTVQFSPSKKQNDSRYLHRGVVKVYPNRDQTEFLVSLN